VVGVAVVAVVLGDPPAEADPDQQVGMDQADQVVGASAAEDLPVAGVVADEGDLGEDDRQVGGGHQLPPGVLQGDEGDPSGGEQDEVENELGGVVPVPPVQQAGLLDLAGELGCTHSSVSPAAASARRSALGPSWPCTLLLSC
jgi:hypothetical protein